MSCRERERERERDKNDKQKLLDSFSTLEQYLHQQWIQAITYRPLYFTGNYDLQILHDNGSTQFTTFSELPTNIQPTLTSYFVDNHNTSLSRQELGDMINRLQKEIKEEKENKPTNWTPYILGGIGIVLLIVLLIVFYLLGRNRNKSRYE